MKEPGFYFARRKHNGKVTIVEVWDDGKTLNLMGSDYCPELDEAAERFEIEILGPVPMPAN